MDSHNMSNTISEPTDVQGAQNTNVQQNLGVIEPAMPPEGFQLHISADSDPQQPIVGDNDVQMDYDDLPQLQEVSDSSEESDTESDSDRDANEVEMQAVDHNDDDDDVPPLIDIDILPSSSSSSRPSLYSTEARPNSNRRARVEDDQDEERDRRHPSQRVSSNIRNNPFATPSSSQLGANIPQVQTPVPSPSSPHIHRHIIRASFNVAGNLDPHNNINALRLFQHLISPANANNNAAPTQNNNPSTPRNDNTEGGAPHLTPPQQPPPQSPQPPGHNDPQVGGVAFSFEIGPGFPVPHGGIPPANQPAEEQPAPDANTNTQQFPPRTGPLADILGLLGRLGGGLDGETVINFGNMGLGLGMHQEKDDPERAKKLVAGLEVVPVGLVRRLERVGGAGGGMGEEPANGGDAGCAICWDKLLDGDGGNFGKEMAGDSPEAGSSSDSENAQPKIVSLPCAHVFHADCLLPWFARPRHTTCPTCRFNIDPENLTHASMRRREGRERAAARRAEDQENTADVEAAPEDAREVVDDDPDQDGAHLPTILDILGGPAAFPPQPSNLQDRSGTARAHSAPPESLPDQPDDSAPAERNPAPASTVATTRNPAPVSTPFAPAAAPTPRLPNFLQTPHGAVGILPLPVPVMIPVHIPASAHAAAGNHSGIVVPLIRRRIRRTDNRILPAAPFTPEQNAFVAQPRREGDFGHLLSRMMRDFRHPVPFNSLFPGLTLNRQQPPQFQPQPTQMTPQPVAPRNASGSATIPGNYLQYYNPFRMMAYGSRTSLSLWRPSYLGSQSSGIQSPDQSNPHNLLNTSSQPHIPPNNSANPAPGDRAASPEPIGNPPNIPHRDVMEIRVDMVFGPGPGAFPFPAGNRQSGAAQPEGQVPNQDETDAFIQQLENDFLQHEQAQGGPHNNINDALRREVEGRLFELLGRRRRANGEPAPANQQAPAQQAGQATVPPPPQQPSEQQQQPPAAPFGNVNPAFLAGLNTGMGMGMHFTGTGRSVAEALSQMIGGMRTQQQQPGQDVHAEQPQDGEQEPTQPAPEGTPLPQPQPQAQQRQAPAGNFLPGFTSFGMFPTLGDIFGGGFPERRTPRPRKDWTLPAAPGHTLRQRIERREQEAGLRCYDVSCGIGPSDEDPYGTELREAAAGMKQLSIMSKTDKSELCSHTFHGPCLVSAERVALRGADAIVEGGKVEVSCPVCRGTGCVSKADWDEGVTALL